MHCQGLCKVHPGNIVWVIEILQNTIKALKDMANKTNDIHAEILQI